MVTKWSCKLQKTHKMRWRTNKKKQKTKHISDWLTNNLTNVTCCDAICTYDYEFSWGEIQQI